MFIKNLKITKGGTVIRDINFHKGLNLIVDETPAADGRATGNNVGKTTVLKLVDFCLGAKPSIVYSDTENSKDVYRLVKDYLINNKVLITLVLTEDLDNPKAKQVTIQRNFLSNRKIIRNINGEKYTEAEFEKKLMELLLPGCNVKKPTFRQIISHNIRYKDQALSNTLKTLNKYTTDLEYETLYLFLLGCNFDKGAKKQAVAMKLKKEKNYKERLEKEYTKTAYQIALSIIEDEIKELQKKKSNFNLNENFERDLEKLNQIKYKINKVSSIINNLKIRRNLINEAKEEMMGDISHIDLEQLKFIYTQATKYITNIQKTFEDLVLYHNSMIKEKINFISSELPSLNERIYREEERLKGLLEEEKRLTEKISKSDSFEDLEELIATLNEKYRAKGEYENIISQIEKAENNIKSYEEELETINKLLFSDNFEDKLMIQVKKFNKFFSWVSEELYGEKYVLKYDLVVNAKKQKLYKFSAFNANLSSGKKQGEILCFDLAYTLFADEEKIPCLHFLLNDKKELMHGNQLIRVFEFITGKNIQLVVSILKDKLPSKINTENNIILKLSQQSKLFRIEENI